MGKSSNTQSLKPIYIKKANEGKFTKKAAAHHESVKQFADKVLDHPGDYPVKTREEAQFAKNFGK